MEPRDYDNLKFILSLEKDALYKWWDSIDGDDQLYAIELIKAYKTELENHSKLLDSSAESDDNQESMDVSEANEYLKKFRISK